MGLNSDISRIVKNYGFQTLHFSNLKVTRIMIVLNFFILMLILNSTKVLTQNGRASYEDDYYYLDGSYDVDDFIEDYPQSINSSTTQTQPTNTVKSTTPSTPSKTQNPSKTPTTATQGQTPENGTITETSTLSSQPPTTTKSSTSAPSTTRNSSEYLTTATQAQTPKNGTTTETSTSKPQPPNQGNSQSVSTSGPTTQPTRTGSTNTTETQQRRMKKEAMRARSQMKFNSMQMKILWMQQRMRKLRNYQKQLLIRLGYLRLRKPIWGQKKKRAGTPRGRNQ